MPLYPESIVQLKATIPLFTTSPERGEIRPKNLLELSSLIQHSQVFWIQHQFL